MGRTRIALSRERAKEEHTLYRLFDEDDRLLYVGITVMPGTRFNQHRREKWWFEDVTRWELETHPDQRSARNAERFAIADEGPLYNKQRPMILPSHLEQMGRQ